MRFESEAYELAFREFLNRILFSMGTQTNTAEVPYELCKQSEKNPWELELKFPEHFKGSTFTFTSKADFSKGPKIWLEASW